MSAFKDSGHFWWQRCQQCRQAWFVGDKPNDVDEDVTCPHCEKMERSLAAAREEGRREGFEKARKMAAELAQRAANDADERKELAERMGRRDAYARAEAQWDVVAPLADDIRALRDGAGEAAPRVEERVSNLCDCTGCPHRREEGCP